MVESLVDPWIVHDLLQGVALAAVDDENVFDETEGLCTDTSDTDRPG